MYLPPSSPHSFEKGKCRYPASPHRAQSRQELYLEKCLVKLFLQRDATQQDAAKANHVHTSAHSWWTVFYAQDHRDQRQKLAQLSRVVHHVCECYNLLCCGLVDFIFQYSPTQLLTLF